VIKAKWNHTGNQLSSDIKASITILFNERLPLTLSKRMLVKSPAEERQDIIKAS